MQARIKNPAMLVPEAMAPLQALNKAIEAGGLPAKLLGLVHLRASQLNGCSFCVDMHARELGRLGETVERTIAVSAWRESPHFSAPERAALALAESMTRLADASDPVPDAIWAEAARHFDERGLAELVLSISLINLWNRLNVATRQPAGQTWEHSPA